ncbi:MAG TPA: penicillin-binding protein 1A [Stellaceae bacterium]|nr:penicillin-binding protein 1A [Stellaceae bacterium]
MQFIRFIRFLFKFMFFLGVLLVVGGAGVAGLGYWYYSRDLPSYQQLADYHPPIVTRVYAGDGRLLAEYATEKRVFVPVTEIPPLVIHAFLAAEDHNFFNHGGVDLLAMARAAVTDVFRVFTHRRPVGASTITQQVAKNFLVGNELSYKRKIKEALVAQEMDKALGKERILELYLNQIYLGGHAFGIAEAALQYFDKSLDELTVPEAALLASLPKAPNDYNPERHPAQARARRDWVIGQMVEFGFISPEEGARAQAEPIALKHRDDAEEASAPYFAEEVRRELAARYGNTALYESGLAVRTSLDPQFQAIADRSLRAGLVAYDRRHGYRGPVGHVALGGEWRPRLATVTPPPGMVDAGWSLAVVLALDPAGASIGLPDGSRGIIPFEEMRWARKVDDQNRLGPVPRQPSDVLTPGDVVMVEALPKAAPNGKPPSVRAPNNEPRYTLRQIPVVGGALVAIDPHSGRVLALDGGFSFDISQFDRATQAQRQVGSAIKPFVYLTAMDHGFTPASVLMDAPLEVDQGPGLPKWRPSNYTHQFYGPLTLRVGVEQSRNLITARLGVTLGMEPIGQTIERFGIMDHVPRVYSMVLGAGETTPLKLTTAYAMLVNGGKKITPTLIDRVQDRNGVTIYRADQRICESCSNVDWTEQPPPVLADNREEVADPRSAYQIVSILQGVVERGTGRIIASLDRPLAGKTGTTNDSNDTWFVGFSPDLAVGVFVGYDQPASLGKHETGASVAAPIFRDFMGAALKGTPPEPFRIPPGIELVRINAETGQLAQPGDKKIIYEAFKPGTEPTGEGPTMTAGTAVNGDDEDAASMAPATPAVDGSGAPGAVDTTGGGVPATPATSTAPRTAPSTGTGGLY